MDRRSDRTRTALHHALRRLIDRIGFDRVSVSMICAEAAVGRSTFYAHFPDKHALRDEGLQRLRIHLRDGSGANTATDRMAFCLALLEHARTHHFPCAPLPGTASEGGMAALVADLVRDDLAAVPLSPAARRQAVRFFAGAFMSMMAGWIEDGMDLPPERLHASFQALALQGLAALTKEDALVR